MKVAVLGGGNGSFAAAADLTEQGHSVSFWRRDGQALESLMPDQSLILKDFQGERTVALHRICSQIGDAVSDAELIVMPMPAFAQVQVARQMATHLKDHAVIFLPPGTFGSVIIARVLRESGCQAAIGLAETGTLPWLARKHGDTTIAITTRATRLPTGAFPSNNAEHILSRVSAAFSAVEPVEDALSGALMNAGPIIHPPLILMNAGPIEHFDHWDIHNEGTQPSIRRVTSALDAERVRAREVLGYSAPHFPLADHYDDERDEWMYGNLAHDKLVDSGDWRESLNLQTHRYMREDVGMGLAFLVSVCEWLNVPCPVARGLLALGSAATGNDYRQSGRTLENLGMDTLTVDAMHQFLRSGELAND